jgi:hypothetical protein
MPEHAGGVLVDGNELRGGGMSYENTVSSATYSQKRRVIIVNNDCDASISGADIITNNIIDGYNAPTGRGRQSNFFQAIEPMYNSIVSDNVVRHFTNGVGAYLTGTIIENNNFIECGDATVGMGGVISIIVGAPEEQNCVIRNNMFYNTQSTVCDITINSAGTDTLSGITISGNKSYNNNYYFLVVTNVKELSVTNNTIVNCWSDNNSNAQACAFLEIGYVNATYNNNEIFNELADGYGMYFAYGLHASSTVGFTRVTNPLSGYVFYGNIMPTKTICPVYLLNDTLMYYPVNSPSSDSLIGDGWYRIIKKQWGLAYIAGQLKIKTTQYNPITHYSVSTNLVAYLTQHQYTGYGSINILQRLDYDYDNIDSIRLGYSGDSAVVDIKIKLENPTDTLVVYLETSGDLEILDLPIHNPSVATYSVSIGKDEVGYRGKTVSPYNYLIDAYDIGLFTNNIKRLWIDVYGRYDFRDNDLTEIDTIYANAINLVEGMTFGSPLNVASGGTGANTLTGLLKGNGTGAITAIAAGTSAQYVRADLTMQNLNQAAITGLSTSDTPTFEGVIVGSSATASAGSIKYAGGHLYFYNGATWVQLAEAP